MKDILLTLHATKYRKSRNVFAWKMRGNYVGFFACDLLGTWSSRNSCVERIMSRVWSGLTINAKISVSGE